MVVACARVSSVLGEIVVSVVPFISPAETALCLFLIIDIDLSALLW